MEHPLLPFREVWKAKKRIREVINGPTPLIYSEHLSHHVGAHIYLKLEHLHPTGSFKLRGAANKILSLTQEEKEKGVATFSTGNHGIAVSYVAGQSNIPCIVCISNRVPAAKVDRLKRLGAQVEVVGESQDDAEARCYELQREAGMTVIKPFDDQEVIAGQGTIGLEIMEQCPEVDQAIIPLSGGGLLSGIGASLKAIDSAIQITGVSMEKSAVMYESLLKGEPVTLKEEDTLADSLLGGLGPNNEYTFPLTQTFLDEAKLVSEESIGNGILFMLTHHKMAVEGAAAAGIGWLLNEKTSTGSHVVLVVSGNNIDQHTINHLIKNQ
ncbi:pyridoxal-phosphate dependent enzyme [Halobacillus sp. K22]|uniref:pyridoxal-phosphate dependent enzyme n=1 Tax=Halobacillus sp. K22 TaxID=3457431 RepID=UPI003FCD2480